MRVSVSPLPFNRKTKSDLGWTFVGLIDGGRLTEYADDGSDITRIYRHHLAAYTYEVLRRTSWRTRPSRVGSALPLGSTAGSRSPQVSPAVTASSPVIVMQSPPEATCNQRKAAVVG
jgi:hypothetical protein